jgi:ABC-type nitrate/sulfonate/bicarbonate transport system substrate-binding protein
MRWKHCVWATLMVAVLTMSTLHAQEAAKIVFPYSPIGLNSLPWMIAKDARIFNRHGLDVDAVFVGFSPLVVSMLLGGSADVAGLGGPAIVTNVLQGGDICLCSGNVAVLR